MTDPKRPEAKNPGKGLATVDDILKAPAMLERFKHYAAKGLDPERLWSVAILAVNNTPALKRARPVELVKALMHVTSLGLEVNSPMGHAYLIPFEKKKTNEVEIQVIIGYRGLAELMYRTGEVAGIEADVATVKEVNGGLFKYAKGTDQALFHQYHPERDEDRDQPAYAWAMVRFKDSKRPPKFEIMPWKAITRIRNGSSGYQYAKSKGEGSWTYRSNPWVAHEWEMAKKTAVRRLAKLTRLSPELARALEIDEAGETEGIDLDSVIDLDPSGWADLDENGDSGFQGNAESAGEDQAGPQEPEKPKGAQAGPEGQESPSAVGMEPTSDGQRAKKNTPTDPRERAREVPSTDLQERAVDNDTPETKERAEASEKPEPSQRAEHGEEPGRTERAEDGEPADEDQRDEPEEGGWF